MIDNPFAVLERKLNRIEALLLELQETQCTIPNPPLDEHVGVKGAAETLNVAEQTIYQNAKHIPHVKRFGKLYFKKSDLLAYLEQGAAPINKKGGKL